MSVIQVIALLDLPRISEKRYGIENNMEIETPSRVLRVSVY